MPPNAVPSTPSRARRRLPWGIIGLIGVLALFLTGVVHLFELRFDVGDIYPPYSTLRSDPLGAKALFASLDGLPGLRVERNLRPLPALGTEPLRPADYDNGEKTFTCFYLGANSHDWPYLLSPEAVERLETIMRRGGRVVVTFQPTLTPASSESLSSARSAARDFHGPPSKREGPTAERLAKKAQPPDLIVRWGIDFRRQSATPPPPAGRTDETHDIPVPSASPPPVEYATPDPLLAQRGGPDAAFATGQEAVPWHSALDFRTGTLAAVASRWQRVYDRRGQGVIVARPFGSAGGELILVGDTYPLSNEGLRNDPSPALLAALVGDGRRVIFDESHLSISEEPGLMTLARRYRLQGALAAVALLAALFVWRNVVSLVPLRAGADAGADTVLGRSADSGYLNLLRRGVRPRDLPGVCLARWEEGAAVGKNSGGGSRGGGAAVPIKAGALERMRAVVAQETALPARKRSPVAVVYRALCAAARLKG